MSDNSQANKRIAKNTLVIYGQMILRMFLGLYTSRVALEALGVSDFGLNSVVGGVVVLFTFISDSLSGTTIRFINVERGKPDGDLNKIFNVCNLLHIAMAIFLFLLLEAGGVYYIRLLMPASEVTAVKTVNFKQPRADQRIYTLDGRQVTGTLDRLTRGIYIINGKKFLVK